MSTAIDVQLPFAISFVVECFGVLLLCIGFSYAYEAIGKWRYWMSDDIQKSNSRPDEQP